MYIVLLVQTLDWTGLPHHKELVDIHSSNLLGNSTRKSIERTIVANQLALLMVPVDF